MTKLIAVTLTLLLLTAIPGYAQTPFNGAYPKVIPVTPNVASLFKMTDRPSGSFTGTTPVNIPIYTISTGNLNIPLSINYNNGGIKVEEIASSVGLGWNLSAGGKITRVVHGLPDDIINNYGYLNTLLKPSAFLNNYPSSQWLQNVNEILRDRLDMEPDMFYYSFNGKSGKFFFNESGGIVLVDKAAIKIEPIMGSTSLGTIIGWILADENGNRYEFGSTEYSYSVYNGGNAPSQTPTYYSAWNLVKITDMTSSREIQFRYGAVGVSFSTISSVSTNIGSVQGVDCISQDYETNSVGVTTVAEEKYLTTIIGDKDSVVFFNSTNRIDGGGSKLDSIKMFAKDGTGLRKRFRFNYDYFSNGGTGPTNKRLKLKTLSEFGSSGVDSIRHSFEYIEDINLPARNSMAVDYWGYFNGKFNNNTLLPNGTYITANYLKLTYTNFADRRSYADYSKANTLKKIVFPTGGSREFIYEGNKYLMEFGSQVTPDESYFNFQQFSSSTFDPDPYAAYAYSQTFNITTDEGYAPFNFELSGYAFNNYHITIYRVIDQWTEVAVETYYNQLNATINLNNGNYRVELKYDDMFGIYDFTYFYAYYNQINMPSSLVNYYGATCYKGDMTAGGIRVKEIKDYDPVTNSTSIKKYKYTSFADSTVSSGQLISPIIVAHAGGCSSGNRDCYYVRLSAMSNYPMVAESGSYVVYPDVTTIEEGNGYKQTKYSFEYDVRQQDIAQDEFPITPRTDNSWKRNKVIFEKTYDNNKNLLFEFQSWNLGVNNSPLANLDNFGPQLLLSSQRAYKVTGYWQTQGCNTSGTELPPCAGCYGFYDFLSHFDGLKATKEITYSSSGGTQENKSEFEYYYNEPTRPLLKRERKVINTNDTILTYYVYPFNNNSEFKLGLGNSDLSMKDSLKNLHYLQPLEVRKYVKRGTDSTFLEGSKFGYSTFNNKWRPSSIKTFTSLTDSTTLRFLKYDNIGNILEQQIDDNLKEVYLWGYNNTYPIAKIIGSDYNSVTSMVNMTILQSPASDAALRTELHKIRTGLLSTTAQVYTYTHRSLTGITSETDPAGRTTYYEYDIFNRLIIIKDHDGRIIKKICYKYYGTPDSTCAYMRQNNWSPPSFVCKTPNNTFTIFRSLILLQLADVHKPCPNDGNQLSFFPKRRVLFLTCKSNYRPDLTCFTIMSRSWVAGLNHHLTYLQC